MKRAQLIVLSMTLMFTLAPIGTPAQAGHLSCSATAFNPSLNFNIVSANGQATCSVVAESITLQLTIQRHRFLGFWKAIGGGAGQSFDSQTASASGSAVCDEGLYTYRNVADARGADEGELATGSHTSGSERWQCNLIPPMDEPPDIPLP